MCIARTKAQGPEANSEEIICLNPRKPTLSKIRGAQRPIFSHGTPILQHSGLPLNLQHLSKFCLNVFRCDPSIKWGVQIVCCCCHDAKLVSPSYFYKLCGIKHISRTRETSHAQTDFSLMHSPKHSNRILPVLAKERKWPKTHPTNYIKKPLGFARCKVHGPASDASL